MESDIRDKFLKMESENGLYWKRVDSFSYWIYIRYQVYNFLYNKIVRLPYSIEPNASEIFKSIIVPFVSLKKGGLKRAEVLFLNGARKTLVEGIYISKEMEGLIGYYNDRALVIEELYYGERYSPTNEYDVFYTDRLDLLCMFYKYVRCFVGKFSVRTKKFGKLAKEISDIIQKYFEINLLTEVNKILIVSYYEYLFWNKQVNRILKRVNPKVILEEDCFCSIRNMVFNEIAHKKSIVTIEIEHGMTDGLVYQYLCGNIEQFPHKLFLFSEYIKEMIRPPLKDEDVIVTGYPFLEEMVEKYSSQDKNKIGNKRVILFISRPAYQLELCRFAMGLKELLKDKSEYEIKFKLHPDERCSKELNESGFDIISGRSKNIYEFLGEAYVQIGIASTGILEGLAFGLRTYCLDLIEIEEMHSLEEKDLIKIVHTPMEVYKDLTNLQGHTAINRLVRDYLWPNNALNNMINEINKTL